MVECSERLDTIFGSLADPIRRDILRRVAEEELSITEIAKPYEVSLAAVSKHLTILEKANLVIKERRGKQQFVHLSPHAIKDASEYLKEYQKFWEKRFDALANYLEKEAQHGRKNKRKSH